MLPDAGHGPPVPDRAPMRPGENRRIVDPEDARLGPAAPGRAERTGRSATHPRQVPHAAGQSLFSPGSRTTAAPARRTGFPLSIPGSG